MSLRDLAKLEEHLMLSHLEKECFFYMIGNSKELLLIYVLGDYDRVVSITTEMREDLTWRRDNADNFSFYCIPYTCHYHSN